jgi:hypothetical protein
LRNRSSRAALRASMDLVPEAAFLSSKPFPLQVEFTKPVASSNKNVPQGTSGAKAHRFVSYMYGLKPVPFRERKT